MDFLHELGCYVTRADGMHVHVGAAELGKDEEACKILAQNWFLNQHLIARMVSSHRSDHTIMGIGVCSAVTKSEADVWGQLVRGQKNWGTRYKSLSFYRVPQRETVEFRLHEGCLDPAKALPWVKFCQGLVDFSISERKVLTCTSKVNLLKALELPEDVVSCLSRRQKLMPTNRRVYRDEVKPLTDHLRGRIPW